jgi:hypothetical protein
LTKAREQARRAACLSNQRQLLIAFTNYAQLFKGALPTQPQWMNAGFGYIAWRDVPPPSIPSGVDYAAWGLLSVANVMGNPAAAYCPAQTRYREFTYPSGWKGDTFFSVPPSYFTVGYVYRIYGQGNSLLNGAALENYRRTPLHKMRPPQALTADLFSYYYRWARGFTDAVEWPHKKGLCAGFSDGHAEWITTLDREPARAHYASTLGMDAASRYHELMFRAFDKQDWSVLSSIPLP